MLNNNDISNHLSNYDFSIKKNKNGRWIDQKCTPDVLTIVSDCIIEHITDDFGKEFTVKDIWMSEYTENYVKTLFNKPSTSNLMSQNEYDKFFSQPIKLLANAKILNEIKKGRGYVYTVDRPDILEFVSLREINSLIFLQEYIEVVLRDSGIWSDFIQFFESQNSNSYILLKEKFENFTINNTKINSKTEVRRIFTKILNPIANKYGKKGTKRGRISSNIITYSELMYNQENFRDINSKKPKNISREQWKEEHPISKNGKEFYKYQSNKAKKFLHKYNNTYRNGRSEYNDEYSNGVTVHMHHIFPENEFPEISMYYENIIALTPSQHYGLAHPNNNTHIIDSSYQELLLKAKTTIIEDNINLSDEDKIIYNFEKLTNVLNIGFNTEYEIAERDFEQVFRIISNYYVNLLGK